MVMEILYLGTESYIQEYLSNKGNLTVTDKKVTSDYISKFDWVISYGYTYLLKKEHISSAKNPILNLHISYLPWNRGFSPNYWSWKNNTPKGVTIHQVDEGLDTGPIYLRQRVYFSEDETLSSSYILLKLEIEKLFINNFDKIVRGLIKPTVQEDGGSYQSKKMLPENIDWSIEVSKI